jgi:ATP-dependent DNA ligase
MYLAFVRPTALLGFRGVGSAASPAGRRAFARWILSNSHSPPRLHPRTALLCCIVDGELVVEADDGRSDLHALHHVIHAEPYRVVFFAFDRLHLTGLFRARPLIERKARLVQLLGVRALRHLLVPRNAGMMPHVDR